jgi:hypothetical protein
MQDVSLYKSITIIDTGSGGLERDQKSEEEKIPLFTKLDQT